MKQETLRENLIRQAEISYLALVSQLDHLFDLVGFYLDRYPQDGTIGRSMKDRELKVTVDNLASLIGQLAEVIKAWKHGGETVLSKQGVELNILNEIWANANALIYFLSSRDIDLEPFDAIRGAAAFHILRKSNLLLT